MMALVSTQGLRQSSCVICSLAFVVACLAMIGYGAQFTGWSAWMLSGLAVVAVLTVRFLAIETWDRLVLWPANVILGAFLISILGSDHSNAALWRSMSMAVFSALLVAVQVCRGDPRAWHALRWSMLVLIAVVLADVLWQRLSGSSLFRDKGVVRSRWMGSQGNANDLVAIMFLAPVAYAVFPSRHRIAGYALFMACLVPVWLISESRQVLLAWSVGLVVPLLSGARDRSRLAILLGAVLLAFGLALLSPLLRMKLDLVLREGVGVREQLAALGLKLGWQFPLTGIGPGCFTEHFLLAHAEGWNWRGKPLPPAGTPWVHCLPVEIFCEFGMIGCVAFASVLVAVVRSLRADARLYPGDRPTLIALRACWISALAVSIIDLTLIKDWVRIEFWLLVGQTIGVGFPPVEKLETRR